MSNGKEQEIIRRMSVVLENLAIEFGIPDEKRGDPDAFFDAIEALKVHKLESGWQPIETAPMNKYILVYTPGKYDGNYHVAGNWGRSGWSGSTGEGCEGWLPYPPTHWMPLPLPPESN